MSSNKKLGNSFEQYLCERLAADGFWTHNFAQNQYGQPADVIAVRNRVAHLIDCKVCTRKGFDLRRIEDNQELSMMRWSETGNDKGYFAILINDEIFMLDSYTALIMRQELSTLNTDLIHKWGIRLEDWIAKCE
jgi:Holliday junction resolvase